MWWFTTLLLPHLAAGATVTWTAGAIGRWREPQFWDSGSVPTSSDDVVITSGTVYLTEDRTIANLEVSGGGKVVLATTECPDGWAVLRRDGDGNSEGCAKAFGDALSWTDAELDCRERGRGGVWRANSSDTLRGVGCYTNSNGERSCRVEDRDTSNKQAREAYTRWLTNGTDAEPGSLHGGYRGHLALIGDEETNRVVSILCAEATNATTLRFENSKAESTGQEMAPGAQSCWIGLSMALEGESMAHDVFKHRSSQLHGHGAAFPESVAPRLGVFNDLGAHPVPEQRSHYDQWTSDRHADAGDWAWVDEGAVPAASDDSGAHGSLYRSWARHEPRYQLADTCAATLHRGYDPASQARARWTSATCESPKPYVCTRRGTTEKHTLTVAQLTLIDGGTLRGGGLIRPTSIVSNEDGVLDGAGLEASSLTTDLTGRHGAWLDIAGTFTLSGRLLGHGAFIMGDTLALSGGRCDWPVHATRVEGSGLIGGGGDLSRGTLDSTMITVDGHSLTLRTPPIDVLRLKADAPVIREDFEYAKEKVVTVMERTWRDWPSSAVRAAGFNHLHFRAYENEHYEAGYVRGIGSYGDFNTNYGAYQRGERDGLKGKLESALGDKDDLMVLERSAFVLDGRGNGRLGPAQGSYRLSVGSEQTECIPWHASAKELSDAINALPSISGIGGATVDKRGDGSRRWGFGFHYEIAYDSAETDTVPPLIFDCEGSAFAGTLSAATGNDCGCVDNVARARTKPSGTCSYSEAPTSASDTQGHFLVAQHASKHGDPGDYCLSRVFGSVDRVVGGGEATVTGSILEFRKGWHRVSATIPATIRVSGHHARVDVAAAAAVYGGVDVSAGTLTFAGPGYRGDDAAALLFAANDREWRAALALREGPSFYHEVTNGATLAGGEIRLASERLIDSYSRGAPPSSVTFKDTLSWTGNGGIRGNGRLVVEGACTMNTCVNHTKCNRTLFPAHVRDGARVVLNGVSTFTGGDIVTGEGAGLDVASTLTLSGSANVLASPIPERTPGRQEDPLNERGWYSNPGCGDACARPPLVKIEVGATLAALANHTVEATLFARGTLAVARGAAVTLGDGGGGDGTFDIAAGGRVSQRNGLLDLERVSLRGEGELGITGGRLFLPGPTRIEPSLNVAGGEAAFRARRVLMASADVTISNGTLSFLADATNGTLHGRFHLSDSGRVRFPERDSYAEPSRFHLSCPSREQFPNHPCQGPYTLDRSHVDVRGQMTWRGGTVSGGGDLHLRAVSTVSDGELKMWARVVNHGGMLLEDGAIVADTEGYLENRGTVEMVGPRTTYRGVTARRPRSETEVTLLHDWEDNMLREGRGVNVVGDDSARASALGL